MRRTFVVVGTVMLAVALYVANSSSWLDSRVLDSDQFVATALDALDEKDTRDASAAIIVDRLIDEFPLLTLLDAPLTRLFSDLLARDAIEGLLVASATNVHQRMMMSYPFLAFSEANSLKRVLPKPCIFGSTKKQEKKKKITSSP